LACYNISFSFERIGSLTRALEAALEALSTWQAILPPGHEDISDAEELVRRLQRGEEEEEEEEEEFSVAALELPSQSSAHVFARVLSDFEADAEDELTLKVDQLVEVTHDAIQCICCIYPPAQTSTNVCRRS
jgi:hypothetical protein